MMNDLFKNSQMSTLGRDAVIKGRIGWRGYKKSDLKKSGPIVIGGINIKNHIYLDYSDIKHISKEKFEESPEIKLKKGDILIVQRGNGIGDVGFYHGEHPEATINPTIIIISDFIGDSKFLFYYLLSNEGNERVLSLASGSSIPAIYQNHLKKLQYPKFPLSEQRAIAHILGSLDDKIELNRRMNQTLESMARAIFKSWFVDFDPVRAKAEGRDPGLPEEIAELFPDGFEEWEIGEVPKEWKAGKLSEIISQQKERVGEKDAVVLSAVSEGELVKSDEYFNKQVYSKKIGKYISVEQWDFAFNPSRINIGSIGMLKEPILGAVSPVYVVFRPNTSYKWFLELTIKQNNVKQWINTLASGSVRQSISFSDFASIPCVIPPKPITEQFNLIYNEYRNWILRISNESKTLINLRDTLLPKLISGELRLPDAEKFIEDIA
jgi:type I restriction enzyme, S subunit